MSCNRLDGVSAWRRAYKFVCKYSRNSKLLTINRDETNRIERDERAPIWFVECRNSVARFATEEHVRQRKPACGVTHENGTPNRRGNRRSNNHEWNEKDESKSCPDEWAYVALVTLLHKWSRLKFARFSKLLPRTQPTHVRCFPTLWTRAVPTLSTSRDGSWRASGTSIDTVSITRRRILRVDREN